MKRRTHLGVYGLIHAKGSIALILKGRGPYTGKWDLPGGQVEFGESPLDALSREIKEEVGLRLLKATPINAVSVHFSYESDSGEEIELHHLGFIYDCEVDATDDLRRTGDDQDVTEAKWFPLVETTTLDLTPFASIHLSSAVAPNALAAASV